MGTWIDLIEDEVIKWHRPVARIVRTHYQTELETVRIAARHCIVPQIHPTPLAKAWPLNG